MEIESKLHGNHFDKVLLVSEIARLESLLDHEKKQNQLMAKLNLDLSKHLKDHANRTFRAMNFPLEKIDVIVQAMRAWIPLKNRKAFDEFADLPESRRGLELAVKALFAEVLADGGAGPGT